MTELLGNPANFRRVVAEYAETATGGGYWLTVDVQSGQTAEHATADQVIAAVRRDDRKAARAGMSTITQLEWRGPAGFVPPELGT